MQRSTQITRRDLLLALADLHRARRADSRVGALQGAFSFGVEHAEPTGDVVPTGLAEMDDEERLRAELEILGLDASHHIMERYLPLLRAIGATSARTLLERRNRDEVLVAGVKVATQTPPVRSGRRVIFLTLDDSTGPVDTTFFEDVQGPYAATVFSSWMLLVRGRIRRTGPRGVSIRATGAWDLAALDAAWREAVERGATEAEALAAVASILDTVPEGYSLVGQWQPAQDEPPLPADGEAPPPDPQNHTRAGGMGRRRVLVHASGFTQSPYSDVKPAGAADAPRKLWHSSPGSSGR